ncbi:MAG: CPBP family intramembrane metalloprotease, partial [Spirochaetia bacterium]|nr:CPBP family intramembrane metalloprotease [Spirochaetia bacterium]
LLSSCFFGFFHLFNLLENPSLVVVYQAVIVSLPGIIYSALLLKGRSLWPAIMIHWLTNAAVNIKIAENPDFQETFSMWLIYGLILIPPVAYSFYSIRKLPETYISDYFNVSGSLKEQEQ